MDSMLESFIAWLLDLFRGAGYPGIVVLMAIESSILPLPSELVMPPAGYLAFTGLGALVWCTILTWIGWFIGSREEVILEVLNQEAQRYTGRALLVALPVLAAITAVYVWWHRRRAAQDRQGVGGGGGGRGEASLRRGYWFT